MQLTRYRITITSPSKEAMFDLVRKHKVHVFDHGNRYNEGVGYEVGAIAEPNEIQLLEAAGYHIERHEDVDKAGEERQKEVGRGNRYKEPQKPPPH